jgi:hypothetical protein
MADTKRYQVVSACAIVPVMTHDGEYLQTLYAGAGFDANPNHPRVAHNVESGYIAEVGAKAALGTDTAGVPMADDKRTAADGEPSEPVDLNDPGVVNEQQQARSAAAAKLPTDGSAPDGRASQAVWVEYLVSRGSRYEDIKDADRADLQKLAKQQQS